MRPTMYVVVNKGLNMSAGKVAAQAVHATLGITAHTTHDWVTHPHRWVIILEAEDEMHLNAIAEYLSERKVDVHLVIDEGVNEVRPYSYTALGVQILDKDSPEAEYLSRLPLYRGGEVKKVESDLKFAKRLIELYQKMTPFEHWVAATMDYVGNPEDLLSRKGRKVLDAWRKTYRNKE